MPVRPFQLEISDDVLADLNSRIARTRWSNYDVSPDWNAGTSSAYLRELVDYWQNGFQWRQQETEINGLPQFVTTVDGTALHFVHQRGVGSDAIPIVLTHGYPDSFLRFRKLIPMLTDPVAHGGDERDVFEVIVPSIPGFGLSEPLREPEGIFRTGTVIHKLLTEQLGYSRYAAHGGDWGGFITEQMARDHRDSVIGIHLTDVPFWHAFETPDDVTLPETEFIEASRTFPLREGSYALIQGIRPQALADGLNDSPAGLAAWLVEKFQRWSDCDGNIESRFTKDELLTNVMLYWATESIGSSFLPYYDLSNAGSSRWLKEKAKEWIGASHVPAAFAMFPKDITHPPRRWAERFFNVERWTEMPRGGHFAALEEPELLVEDIRAFFRPHRAIRAG